MCIVLVEVREVFQIRTFRFRNSYTLAPLKGQRPLKRSLKALLLLSLNGIICDQ